MQFLKKIKYFIYIRLRSYFETVCWRILKLNIKTNTGLNLLIKRRSDWQIYNEIFSKGDYDFAINKALDKKENNSDFFFLDLGANVGFFTFRLLDIMRGRKTTMPFSGLMVEGSEKVYKDLTRRVKNNYLNHSNIKLIYGLAGKREGSDKIFESANTVTNTLKPGSQIRSLLGGKRVPYINLYKHLNGIKTIDILKCDIEGSEEEFLKNYFDLLACVRVAVFELHAHKCNAGNCISIIEKSGLINRQTMFVFGDVTLEVFWR